jgi:DNA-binding MarR family transcriptional regulator
MTNLAHQPDSAATAEQRVIAEVMDGIRAVVRALRLNTRAIEKQLGISLAQLWVLQILEQKPADSLNELAVATATHQSSVSVVVSRLVDRGLVSRDASIEDSRRVSISITPPGRQVLRRAPEQAAQARLLAGLREISPREIKVLTRALRRLASSMEIDTAKR